MLLMYHNLIETISDLIFKNACILKQNIKKHGKLEILKGKTIGLYFEEPSSRTYGSFYVAVKKLGGDVLPKNSSVSSTKRRNII